MKKILNISFLFYIILITIFSASIIFAGTLEDDFSKTIDFGDNGKISVQNRNGKIVVEGWDKSSVKIEATKQVRGSSRKKVDEFMEHLKIRVEENNDEINIETDFPNKDSGFLDWMFGNGMNASVEYHIWVPYKSNLKLRSSNGRVEALNIEGNLILETTNGKIVAEEIKGSVDAHTTNGSINIHLLEFKPDDDLGFFTTNGGIKAYLPREAKFDLRASTTNGSIDSEFPLEVRGKYNSKRVRGKINGGGTLLEMQTTNGSIHIYED